MRTTRGKAAAAVLGGMLLTATAACGGQAADGAGRAAHAREVTAAETALLAAAEEELVERCMERRGFKYWPAAPPAPDELRDFPYVVDDLAWARRHGYGSDLSREAARLQKSDPNAAYAEGLSPKRRTAYAVARNGDGRRSLRVTIPSGASVGQNSTGCIAESQRQLYGDFQEWFRASTVAGNLPDRGRDVRRDPRMRAAVAEWSSCMKKKGHQYSSPLQLQKSLTKAADGTGADRTRRTEIRLATAEASCARSTRLSATVRALTRHFDRAAGTKYGKYIEARNRMRLAALERARELTPRGTAEDTASGR